MAAITAAAAIMVIAATAAAVSKAGAAAANRANRRPSLKRSRSRNSIGAATGAKVQVYLPSVGGEKQVTNYFELFDYDIDLIKKALQ